MDWAGLPDERVRQLEGLASCDPERMLARLEAAFAFRHSDSARCHRIAEEERAHAEQRGHRHALAVAWTVCTYSARFKDFDDARRLLDDLREANDILIEVGDVQNEIRASDLLATIHEGMGDYPTALRYTEATLRQCRAIGDRLFEGYGLSSLAGILTAAGDLEGAKQQIDAALVIADELGVARLHTRMLVRKGRVERQLGRLDEALENFRTAKTLAISSQHDFAIIDALTEIAKCHEDRGDLHVAEEIYDDALNVMDEELRTVVGPTAMLGLARICMHTRRPRRAIELVEKLQPLADVFGMRPIQLEAAELLAEAYRNVGAFEAAFAALKEFVALKEEMMKGEAERAVKKLQVKADLEAAKKDAEIYRLKYVELETMQTQLVESERMAVVGHLTAGLAHEMNTPLGVVRSNLDTTQRALVRLQEALPSDLGRTVAASTRALMTAEATSRAAVERLEALVDSFRRFAKLDESDYQVLDLVDGLDATIDVLSTTLPEGIRVERALQPVPPILGWPGALNQAFLTLMKNAAEALKSRGTITIATDVCRPSHDEVVVRIADDGPGIPSHIKDRLFDLELSRSGPRARFRIGLATVQAVVQRHQGRIEVFSEVGQGTEFSLFFPAGALR